MSEKKYTFHQIADYPTSLSFNQQGIAVVEVKGKKICIARYKEEWYAFGYKCPHASGIMSEGYLDAIGNVVCPVHRYKFNLKNGRNTSGEGYYLKTYPVEVRGEAIFVYSLICCVSYFTENQRPFSIKFLINSLIFLCLVFFKIGKSLFLLPISERWQG
jgi:3-phenylpropionate/trans-cinnamate dioxygenase ferredoxin subunit